jgi:hypothetical protein
MNRKDGMAAYARLHEKLDERTLQHIWDNAHVAWSDALDKTSATIILNTTVEERRAKAAEHDEAIWNAAWNAFFMYVIAEEQRFEERIAARKAEVNECLQRADQKLRVERLQMVAQKLRDSAANAAQTQRPHAHRAPFEPRDYQAKTIEAAVQSFSDGFPTIVVRMLLGQGITATALGIVARMKLPTVWIARLREEVALTRKLADQIAPDADIAVTTLAGARRHKTWTSGKLVVFGPGVVKFLGTIRECSNEDAKRLVLIHG